MRQEGERRSCELFNVGNDPCEKHELSAEYPDKVRERSVLLDEECRLYRTGVRGDVDQSFY